MSDSTLIEGETISRPSFFISILPIAILGVLLSVGFGLYNLDIEIVLIIAAIFAGIFASRLGHSYKSIESGVIESTMKGMPSILIVIVVGSVIGTWIASGTIPMIIYYGLDILNPNYFLATACIVCSVISLMSGTSWGTLGTLGVAFMGIAEGLGVPLSYTAGALVAGSYFGDKLSPFSDTTNLAPLAVGSNLYDHIKHTLWTTTPAWLLGLCVYIIIGTNTLDTDLALSSANELKKGLESQYVFSWVLLLPTAIILYFAFRKKPIIPGLLVSSGVSVLLAVKIQGISVNSAISTMVIGNNINSGVETLDILLNRGGMTEMMEVVMLAFCAFAFAGIIQKAQMLEVILHKVLSFATSARKLIASAIAATLSTSVLAGSAYLSILIPGELFAPAFKRQGLAAKNLSRIVEDSGTVVVPLIPWSVQGIFISEMLGVSTIEYLPWAIMCYCGFIFSLAYGFTGFTITKIRNRDETQPGS